MFGAAPEAFYSTVLLINEQSERLLWYTKFHDTADSIANQLAEFIGCEVVDRRPGGRDSL